LIPLQKSQFIFDGTNACIGNDTLHEPIRDRLKLGARYILRQIQLYPDQSRDNLVQYVASGLESSLAPFAGAKSGGALVEGHVHIHAMKIAPAAKERGKVFAKKL
jgi:hypothetical protein